MSHNTFIAAALRGPEALGVHLSCVQIISASKVAAVFRMREERYPTVGSSLLPVFFPGGVRVKPDEKTFRDAAAQRRGLAGHERLHVTLTS